MNFKFGNLDLATTIAVHLPTLSDVKAFAIAIRRRESAPDFDSSLYTAAHAGAVQRLSDVLGYLPVTIESALAAPKSNLTHLS